MISAYVGLPGAGKSYAVVANVILPALEMGRRVVTNIPLKRDAIRKRTPKGEIVEFPTDAVAANPDSIEDYCTPGSIVVLDELWRFWPSGQKQHQVPVSFRSLLAEHRHRVDAKGVAMEIVLVTQDVSQIAAWARALIETTYVHQKLNVLGADNKFRVAIYRGAPPTVNPGQSGFVREIISSYKKDIYVCYESHTMRQTAGSGADEKSVDRRANIWRRPVVWVGIAAAVVLPAYGAMALYNLVEPDPAPAAAASEASPGGQAGPSSSRPARAEVSSEDRSPPSVAPIQSRERPPDYRLAGVVRSPDDPRKGFAAIASGSRIVNIPVSECWEAGDGITRCSFNGRTVTELGVE